jgi:hypothetical protein
MTNWKKLDESWNTILVTDEFITLDEPFKKMERHQEIEQDMKRGKNVKRFSQKDAVKYLKKL